MGIAVSEDELSMPQLVNINEDQMKSGAVIFALRAGTTTVGRPDAEVPQTIKFVGLNMSKEHCRIINDGGEVSIVMVGNSRTWVNGNMLDSDSPQRLRQNDRIRFGKLVPSKLPVYDGNLRRSNCCRTFERSGGERAKS
eukprot:320805-Hanusia_phi.AAC.3